MIGSRTTNHHRQIRTIKRHIPIKRHQLQRPTPHQTQNLRRIQDQPNIVERRRHEAARADPPLSVLILKRLFQQQRREKDPDAWNQQLQLGPLVRTVPLVRDVVVDQVFHLRTCGRSVSLGLKLGKLIWSSRSVRGYGCTRAGGK